MKKVFPVQVGMIRQYSPERLSGRLVRTPSRRVWIRPSWMKLMLPSSFSQMARTPETGQEACRIKRSVPTVN